jgi:hypothetical protein
LLILGQKIAQGMVILFQSAISNLQSAIKNGWGVRFRTSNIQIQSLTLYQLSYTPASGTQNIIGTSGQSICIMQAGILW